MVCFIRYLATTHFEPTDARNAFPCFDEPNMKAKFSVVITRERRHVALGNMPIQHTEGVRAAVAIYRLPCTPLYSTGQMGSCGQSCIKGTHGQGSTNASNQDTINSWATCTCTTVMKQILFALVKCNILVGLCPRLRIERSWFERWSRTLYCVL